MNEDSDAPLPSRVELLQWLHGLDEQAAAGRPDGAELAHVLALVRRTARDLGWVADYLVLLAREQGASYPDLAQAWSATGRRELVNGPRTRLHRLIDAYGTAAELLAAIDLLASVDAPADTAG